MAHLAGLIGASALMGGRLSLTSSTWLTTADVTAATDVYFTPGGNASGGHNNTMRSNGSVLSLATLTELRFRLTDAQNTNVTYNNGSPLLTNLSSTSQLVRGMTISSSTTGIGALTISSIDSSSQVTMSGNASVNHTGATITFKLPASKNYDVFDVNGVLQLSNSWTSDTARNDALGTLSGITVNNAAINSGDSNSIAAKAGVYLGTIRTTATAGQTEDSRLSRLVWNLFNPVRKNFYTVDSTSSWNYTLTTFEEFHGGSTVGQTRCEVVIGLNIRGIHAQCHGYCNNNSTVAVAVGIGIDSSSTNSALTFGAALINSFAQPIAEYEGFPGIGYHTVRALEASQATGTTTWASNTGVAYVQTGLAGFIDC